MIAGAHHLQVTSKTFWQALGSRAVGVAVVTSIGADGPVGFLALSGTHLTADPPTMLVSVAKSSSSLQAMETSGVFAINYLREDAAAVADIFAGKTGLKGNDRFANIGWRPLKSGAPALDDAIGVLGCRVLEKIERFGTIIIIAELETAETRSGPPLVHFRGKTITSIQA